jgi:hypothetical protein
MMILARSRAVIPLALAMSSPAAAQQTPPDIPAHQQAIKRLEILKGQWRGQATVLQPGKAPIQLTHTERVGPLLDGSILLIEGKSYRPDGEPGGFNAFAVVSFDQATGSYVLRSYASGHAGDFPLTVTADGFIWSMQAGPNAKIRHVATVGNGRWREDSFYEANGKPPVNVFTMDLQRIGDSTWPTGRAVPAKP